MQYHSNSWASCFHCNNFVHSQPVFIIFVTYTYTYAIGNWPTLYLAEWMRQRRVFNTVLNVQQALSQNIALMPISNDVNRTQIILFSINNALPCLSTSLSLIWMNIYIKLNIPNSNIATATVLDKMSNFVAVLLHSYQKYQNVRMTELIKSIQVCQSYYRRLYSALVLLLLRVYMCAVCINGGWGIFGDFGTVL